MIVVFGSINLDLVAEVARFPRPGETVAGISFAALPGGKGANQALAARRAGAIVAMAGAVGTDAFAATALSGLAEAGVDLAWVRQVDTLTGVALIHVAAGGQNSITVIAGANARVQASAVPDVALHVGTTLLLQLEVPLAAVCDVAARAGARGARVVLNAAPAHELPNALMSTLDVLIVNEHEAEALATGFGMPVDPEAFATAVHRQHGCAVVVTLGGRGALAVAEANVFFAAAPAVEVIDTTGAGDAFTGALAAALDRNTAWPRALAEGVAAGSLACGGAGAQAALPMSTAIDRLAATVQSSLVFHSID